MRNKSIAIYTPLFIIILLGFLLRIFHLDQRSIWYDEANSIYVALKGIKYFLSPDNIILFLRASLYYFVLGGWIKIFGLSETSLRFLSVLFNTLSIYLLFQVGKTLFNKRVALYSSFLLSLSTFHIMWSQQARPYTLFTLFAILSALSFYKVLARPNNKNYLFYLFINIALVWTHIFGIFLILAQDLFLLILFRKKIVDKKWILGQLIILSFFILLTLPYIKMPYLNCYGIQKSKWDFQGLRDTLESFSYGGENIAQGGLTYGVEQKNLILPKLLIYIFGFFFIFSLFPYKNIKDSSSIIIKKYHWQIFLLFWLFSPIIASFLLSLFFPWTYLVRYLIFISPAYYLGIGLGLGKINFKYQVFFLVIIFILSLITLRNYYYPKEIASWRELSKDVKENIGKFDVILFAPINQLGPFWYYYKGKNKEELSCIGVGFRGTVKLINGVWHSEFEDGSNNILGPALDINKTVEFISRNPLRKLSKRCGNIWLIISPWIGQDNAVLLHKYLSHDYLMVYKKQYPFEGLELYKYEMK